MKKQILITGATGLVGKKLIAALQQDGHSISILSRKNKPIKNVKVYLWDVYNQKIDSACLDGIDTIIHLAGEPIAEKKWTKERKQQIIDSRVMSTHLLYKTIKETQAPVTTFISASAVGYYGDREDEILTEESSNGTGFMARCCMLWEDAVDEGKSLNLRIVKFRIGFVLAKNDGALASLDKPIRFFVGAPLGTGKQWIPWVHIDDIVSMFKLATDHPTFEGAYNACAPFPVTNATLTKAVAKELHRPVWPLKVPEKVLEMILGKMSVVVTLSTNTSAQKLLNAGFIFQYTHLEDALADIYAK
ncbi:TIGR01777 family oxidoreductase [Pedobacter frigoris]|uniref:TIGR01777 family oxidoreductase n=1 Tax=Pedobacter frigoris TaxID=2571272 RepID=UPI00292FBAA6|nr:TIGR01777 family oxidoreductase [Pedobacter frigoris]